MASVLLEFFALGWEHTASITDGVAAVDLAASAADYDTTVTDSLELIDAVAVESRYGVLFGFDMVDLFDSEIQTSVMARAPPEDPVALTDLASSWLTVPLEVTAAVGLTDSVTHIYALSIDDGLASLDSISHVRWLTDAIGANQQLSDSIAWAGEVLRSLTDGVALGDQASPLRGIAGDQTDVAAITDGITLRLGSVQSETIGLAEGTILHVGQIRSDALGLVDGISIQVGGDRSDGIAATDGIALHLSTVQPDPVGLADSVALVAAVATEFGESLALLDEVIISRLVAPVVTDELAVDDEEIPASDTSRVLFDEIGLKDSGFADAPLPDGDGLAIADTVVAVRSRAFLETHFDAVGLVDSVLASHVVGFQITDNLGLVDRATVVDYIPVRSTIDIGEAGQFAGVGELAQRIEVAGIAQQVGIATVSQVLDAEAVLVSMSDASVTAPVSGAEVAQTLDHPAIAQEVIVGTVEQEVTVVGVRQEIEVHGVTRSMEYLEVVGRN